MLARRRQDPAFRREKSPKVRRRDEFQTERGKTRFKQAAFERLDLTARWNDDNNRSFAFPSLRCGPPEPVFGCALPDRFRRWGEQQCVPAFRLKLQFQLHSSTLACPFVAQLSAEC